jgi:hypothetical protein
MSTNTFNNEEKLNIIRYIWMYIAGFLSWMSIAVRFDVGSFIFVSSFALSIIFFSLFIVNCVKYLSVKYKKVTP